MKRAGTYVRINRVNRLRREAFGTDLIGQQPVYIDFKWAAEDVGDWKLRAGVVLCGTVFEDGHGRELREFRRAPEVVVQSLRNASEGREVGTFKA